MQLELKDRKKYRNREIEKEKKKVIKERQKTHRQTDRRTEL